MYRGYLWVTGLCGLTGLLATGCGGGGYGGEIRVPVEQRHALTAGSQTPDQIRLPGDRLFNIHLKNSNRDAGPQGTALGDSDATPDGQAFCAVSAGGEGVANAEFTIGHRVDNESDRRLAATIQVEFELQQELQAPGVPAAKTLATANLTLTILDGRKHTLATVPVLAITSDQAVGSAQSTCRHNLSALLEPQQSYSVILQGNTHTETTAGQEASGRLQVRNLHMRLTFAPAPPASGPAAGTSRPASR
ncbi:MAG TPA: hypothetical protein VLM89_16530 [Phycisphaerae bacterium]|nr:hypothetical protein [Phycisphaerae bacterium]